MRGGGVLGWLAVMLLGIGTAVAAAPVTEVAAEVVTIDLGEAFAGRVAVVNVWATWCGPCLEELPRLDALHDRLDPTRATVVAVNVDPTEARARAVIRRLRTDLPVVYDPQGTLTARLAPPSLPTTFLVDSEGTVRAVYAGALDADAMAAVEADVRALLEPGGAAPPERAAP